jgi:hypothetical protein
MNELSNRFEWDVLVRNMRQQHASLSALDSSGWAHKIQGAMNRLPYLKSLGNIRLDDDSIAVGFKVVLKEVANNLSAVQTDFRTVLKQHVIGSRVAHAAFSATGTGFDVWLAILDEEERLFTAVIKVEAS